MHIVRVYNKSFDLEAYMSFNEVKEFVERRYSPTLKSSGVDELKESIDEDRLRVWFAEAILLIPRLYYTYIKPEEVFIDFEDLRYFVQGIERSKAPQLAILWPLQNEKKEYLVLTKGLANFDGEDRVYHGML
jgi:hypothetical protein